MSFFMTTTSHTNNTDIDSPLKQLTAPLDAMHVAQLTAFAFAIPQLYFCREYLQLNEQDAIRSCLTRLQRGLGEQVFTIETLIELLKDRDYFTAEEARLRLAPEPDFESLSDE